MGSQTTFNIREFGSQDLEKVQDLFSRGLIELAGKNFLGVCRYIDRALKDDMADIATQYQRGFEGNFWVVEYLDSLVGHLGIQTSDKEDEAELRRMTVSTTVRRQGVGRRLLRTTEEFCRCRGYKRIILSTVDF